MRPSDRYLKIVEWSEEDQCYAGTCPGLMLGGVHGDDEAKVYKELCQAVDEWIRICEQDGDHLPPATAGKDYSEQKDIVRQGYDRVSHAYRADDSPEDYSDYAAWVRILTERLPQGAPVLDAGCGCGLPATRLLADRFAVTGVDFSEVQIARARRLVPAARFLCGDISEQSFAPGSYAAVVSFYAIIHIPLDEQLGLLQRIAGWLRPAGYFLATVGHAAWTGQDEAYLGVPGVRMCWSHADEATYVRWFTEAGLCVHWTRFVPEGDSGHTLVLAQKPGHT